MLHPAFTFNTATYAITANDIVSGTKKANLITSVAAENSTGTLTKIALVGTAAALTYGGVTYPVASAAIANLGPDEAYGVRANQDATLYTMNTGLTGYLSNGYVIGVIPDAVAYADYVFAVAQKGETGVFGNTVQVGYVKQDATTALVTAAPAPLSSYTATGSGDVKPINAWATATEMGASTAIKATAFTKAVYVVGGDTAMSAAKVTYGDERTVDSQKTYKVTVDAKTTFVVRTDKGFFSYSGISKLPTLKIPNGAMGYALVPGGDVTKNHAVAFYIDISTAGSVALDKTSMIYVVSAAPTGRTNDLYNPYTFATVEGGKATTEKSTDAGLFVAPATSSGFGFLVTPYYDGATKYLGAATTIAPAADNAVVLNGVTVKSFAGDAYNYANDALVYNNLVLTVNGADYAVAEDATVYVYDLTATDGEFLSTISVEDLTGYEGVITLVGESKDNKITKTVYLTVVPDAVLDDWTVTAPKGEAK